MTDSACHVCGNTSSKYSCPRCKILYCSVTCYQSEKHSQCSEIFYEKCVREQLQDYEAHPDAKRRMIEILKKQQNLEESENSLDSDDEEDIPDLASRLEQVNLDDEQAIWEKLTSDEKLKFRNLVSTGNIINILPALEPWWKLKKRKTFIQECGENNSDWRSMCPSVPSNIPHISKLSKTEPSSYLSFMILNVLYSYIFTWKWFKGNHKDMPVEAISTCLALSATLKNSTVFKNPIEAFVAFEDDFLKCEWITDKNYDKDLLQKDLIDIINGADNEDSYFSIKCCFSDIATLCSQAIFTLKNCKTNHLKRFSGPSPSSSQLQLISRKMMYYLSWTESFGSILVNLFQQNSIKN